VIFFGTFFPQKALLAAVHSYSPFSMVLSQFRSFSAKALFIFDAFQARLTVLLAMLLEAHLFELCSCANLFSSEISAYRSLYLFGCFRVCCNFMKRQ
jgi:hypothetical protein